jgi:hypothetical protein
LIGAQEGSTLVIGVLCYSNSSNKISNSNNSNNSNNRGNSTSEAEIDQIELECVEKVSAAGVLSTNRLGALKIDGLEIQETMGYVL